MNKILEVIAPTKMKLKEARLYDNEWRLEVTANDGSVTTFPSASQSPQTNYLNCVLHAKLKATPDVHMMIIKKDGRDFQRWDRDCIVDSNHWQEVEDLSDIKVIGQIVSLRWSVVNLFLPKKPN